jgi:hypothetical protein
VGEVAFVPEGAALAQQALGLRAVKKGAPYSVPIALGRWVWRLKRLSPSAFLFATLVLQKRFMGPRAARQEG